MLTEVILLDYTFLYISILILTFWNAYQSCPFSLVCMQFSGFSLTSKPVTSPLRKTHMDYILWAMQSEWIF